MVAAAPGVEAAGYENGDAWIELRRAEGEMALPPKPELRIEAPVVVFGEVDDTGLPEGFWDDLGECWSTSPGSDDDAPWWRRIGPSGWYSGGVLDTAVEAITWLPRALACMAQEMLVADADVVSDILLNSGSDCDELEGHCGQVGLFTFWLRFFDHPGRLPCHGPQIAVGDWMASARTWSATMTVEGTEQTRVWAGVQERPPLPVPGGGSVARPATLTDGALQDSLNVRPVNVCEGSVGSAFASRIQGVASDLVTLICALWVLLLLWALPRILAAGGR